MLELSQMRLKGRSVIHSSKKRAEGKEERGKDRRKRGEEKEKEKTEIGI